MFQRKPNNILEGSHKNVRIVKEPYKFCCNSTAILSPLLITVSGLLEKQRSSDSPKKKEFLFFCTEKGLAHGIGP